MQSIDFKSQSASICLMIVSVCTNTCYYIFFCIIKTLQNVKFIHVDKYPVIRAEATQRETRGEEGGRREGNACQETIVFCIMNIHQVNVEITPSFASLFTFLSRPKPLSLSFQMPATEASHHCISSLLPSCAGSISQQSNQ